MLQEAALPQAFEAGFGRQREPPPARGESMSMELPLLRSLWAKRVPEERGDSKAPLGADCCCGFCATTEGFTWQISKAPTASLQPLRVAAGIAQLES